MYSKLMSCGVRGKALASRYNVRPGGVRTHAFMPTDSIAGVLHQEAQEVAAMGVLHVSALQAHTCLQDIKDLEQLSAPSLSEGVTAHSMLDLLQQAASHNARSDAARMARTALCLATPEDSVPEEGSPVSFSRAASAQTVTRPTFRSTTMYSSGNLRAPPPADCVEEGCEVATRSLLLQEELALLEYAGATSWHLSEASGCQYTRTVLQAASSVRRRRRRALVRVLRAGRDAVNQVVSSIDAYAHA